MAFNEAQREAISHKEGPILVLAGPGSGKTTVLTERVRSLIEESQVPPGSILVITFTRAAAREMQQRFERLVGGEKLPVTFGTFHSVFFRILKLAYGYQGKDIVREEQRVQFLKELIAWEEIETEDEADFVASVLGEISAVKGEMMDLSCYYSKNCPEEVFKKLYRGYEERLRALGLIDFDDMLVMCYQLFSERKDILAAWQRKYTYILIDEFQDINRIQYEIVRMLALPENNLFIVGDDDQSIYRFRGARPEIMLGFERDYPGAKKVLLNVNYRSTKTIVETAGRLIEHNRTRFPKEIRAEKEMGAPVRTCFYPDAKDEALGVVKEILAWRDAGYPLSDIAVLYRTSLEPRLLVERLMEYNVPFKTRDSLPNIYEHWISRNILAYIRAAMGDLDRGNVLEFINRPKRYISRDALETSPVSWERVKSFYQDREWMEERIEQLEFDLAAIARLKPAAAVNYIRKAVGYNDYLKEYASFRRMKEEELLEVADQLQESAAGYPTFQAWFTHMEEYGRELAEQARRQTEPMKDQDGVTLMTMHGSKGLEYRFVYIIDANEGITPHRKAALEADLEEERRMFYVAMTRAKERLCICSVRERYGRKQEPSRFIREYYGRENSSWSGD